MVRRCLAFFAAGAALLANAAFAAGPIPKLPADLPASTDAMAKAAAADPAAYREVLLNCAAAQGVVAMVKNKAAMSSTGHDQMAILLIHVAGTLPPADEWAASQAYSDKLFAFDQALQRDETGTVQFDLLKLTQSCAVVEQYADATAAKEQAASPAGAEPANPMFDEKQREDIINELMGIKKDEPAPKAEEPTEAEPAPPAIALLPSEKAVIAGLFAEGTDEPSAYGSMLMDCAALHGLRAAFTRAPKKRAAHEAKEKLFLDATRLVTPFARVDADHIEDVARYKQGYIGDKTGEIRNELDGMTDTCAAMETPAQERIDMGAAQ